MKCSSEWMDIGWCLWIGLSVADLITSFKQFADGQLPWGSPYPIRSVKGERQMMMIMVVMVDKIKILLRTSLNILLNISISKLE